MGFLQIADLGTVHFHEYGKGKKPMLAFHGYGMTGRQFHVLKQSVLQEYHVYGIDHFFHGESRLDNWTEAQILAGMPKAQVRQYVEEWFRLYGRQRFSVMGYSIGANLALILVEEYADLIDDLILMLRSMNVSRVHIHHLIAMDVDISSLVHRLELPFDLTVHDYYGICPQTNLLPRPEGLRCDEPDIAACNACIAASPIIAGVSFSARIIGKPLGLRPQTSAGSSGEPGWAGVVEPALPSFTFGASIVPSEWTKTK